jgi:hypothetical protein
VQGFEMSEVVQNSREVANLPSTEERNSSMNYYVIAAVVLAMAALLAYQMFGCADCYAPI